jgi:hypothetical protein
MLGATAAQAQQMALTPQIGLGTLEQATPDQAFETRTLAQLRDVKAAAQGFTGEMLLLRKDRGPHAGRYAVFVTAPAGSGRHISGAAQRFPSVKSYQLVGADKIGPLPTVDVLGVHYIKVQPGRQAAFDQFITDKLNPAVANLRPDLRFLYYKSPDGGYITIIAITKASRDKYWPNGADSDDLKTAFTPAVRALANELQTYLVEGSWGVNMTAQVYEAKEWADWIVVPAAAR